MTINQRDLEIVEEQTFAPYDQIPDLKRGRVVEVGGDIEGAVKHVWVQPIEENSPPIQVFNPGVQVNLQSGALVYYQQHPRRPARWQLFDMDSSIWADQPGVLATLDTMGTGPHHTTHEWYPGYLGADAVNVSTRQITDLAVRPTDPASMRVRVYSGWYPGQTNYERFAGPKYSDDLTSDIPSSAGKAVIVAIVLLNDGSLDYAVGTEFVDGDPIPSTAWPEVGVDAALLSAVRLVNGMTAITEANFDHEMRAIMATGGLARSYMWQVVPSTNQDIYYNQGSVTVGHSDTVGAELLQVSNQADDATLGLYAAGATYETAINLSRSRGGFGLSSPVQASDVVGSIEWKALADSGYMSTGLIDNTITSISTDDVRASMDFYTHSDGDADGITSRKLSLGENTIVNPDQRTQQDFIVRSLNNANMLRVDSSNDAVLVGYSAPAFGEDFGVNGGQVVFQDTPATTNSKFRFLNNRDSDGYNYFQVGTDSSDTSAKLRLSRFASTQRMAELQVLADQTHLSSDDTLLGATSSVVLTAGLPTLPAGLVGGSFTLLLDTDQRAAMSFVNDTWGHTSGIVTGAYVADKTISGAPQSAGYFESLGSYTTWGGRPLGVFFTTNSAYMDHMVGTAVPSAEAQSVTWQSLMRVGLSEIRFNIASIDVDFRVESNTNTAALMVDAGNSRVGVETATPDHLFQVHTTTASEGAHVGNAYVGNWSNTAYAQFSHWSYRGTTNYALIQQSTGHTYLNCNTGTTVFVRVANSNVASFASGGMTLYLPTSNLTFVDATNTGGTTSNGYITVAVPGGTTRYIWLNPIT